MQDNIKGAEEDAEAAQKKLQQMGSGKLKTVEMRVQDLGLKLASLKGDQDTLSDSVKVCQWAVLLRHAISVLICSA